MSTEHLAYLERLGWIGPSRRYPKREWNTAEHKALQAKAIKAVRSAILRRDLWPANYYHCIDCGRGATRYDHRDYEQPLMVEPVCGRCNILRGPAKPYRPLDMPHYVNQYGQRKQDTRLPSHKPNPAKDARRLKRIPMNIITTRQLSERYGSITEIAKAIGLSRQAVWLWFRNDHVPNVWQYKFTLAGFPAPVPKPAKESAKSAE